MTKQKRVAWIGFAGVVLAALIGAGVSWWKTPNPTTSQTAERVETQQSQTVQNPSGSTNIQAGRDVIINAPLGPVGARRGGESASSPTTPPAGAQRTRSRPLPSTETARPTAAQPTPGQDPGKVAIVPNTEATRPSATEPTPALGTTTPLPSADATRLPAGSNPPVSNPPPASQAVEELKRLQATAKRVQSITERDSQLVMIVRRAIDKREYRAAIDIASDIFTITTRDNTLGSIACYALHVSGDRTAAEAAAVAVYSIGTRDEVYRRIIAWATSTDQSKDIPCAKP